jgi:hypothetical protein
LVNLNVKIDCGICVGSSGEEVCSEREGTRYEIPATDNKLLGRIAKDKNTLEA